jgi:hypothetical protein
MMVPRGTRRSSLSSTRPKPDAGEKAVPALTIRKRSRLIGEVPQAKGNRTEPQPDDPCPDRL